MNIQDKIDRAFVFPIKFDPGSGYFFDQNNQMVAQVRAWGHLENEFGPDAELVQDTLGEMIATAFNEKYCKPVN